MATSVATGYYAICFPNPIGTSGGNVQSSTVINAANFSIKSALLPQSCLGIALTTLTGTASTSNVWYRTAAAVAAAVTA
jgi:hypothetical protein